jgi:Ca2+-binding RTX toxin-like protein
MVPHSVGWSLRFNQEKEPFTMVSYFGLQPGIGRDHKARSRRLEARVEGLEGRELMTAGSVVQVGSAVSVMPASTGASTTVVSYQNHNGNLMIDVNLNGNNNYFGPSQVYSLSYLGNVSSGAQTFEDTTSLNVVALGGSGTNLFEGGSGQDTFFGGPGTNTFDAGSGYDLMVGGYGLNVFNENAVGSGEIIEIDNANTVTVPSGGSTGYLVF